MLSKQKQKSELVTKNIWSLYKQIPSREGLAVFANGGQ